MSNIGDEIRSYQDILSAKQFLMIEKGYSAEQAEDLIEKATKDVSKLTKKVVTVTRGGKTFKQVVYVKQGEEDKQQETPIGEELSPEVNGMQIEKYSDKAVLVKGDTYVNLDTLRNIKNDIRVGSFNKRLRGWIFPLKYLDTVLGHIWSGLIDKGEDDKAQAVQNQKNAGLEKGDEVNISGEKGKVDENVSNNLDIKYNITLSDGTKLEGVSEKIMNKPPETDDKKISEAVNNANTSNRAKTEKKLYGIKPIKDIHKYSLQEYMGMHGISQAEIDSVVESLKNTETKDESQKRASSGGKKKEYTGNKKEGLTKKQLIGKLIYAHYQAVSKAIDNGEELDSKVLDLYDVLKEKYNKKRQAMSEETKRKISEALKKNKAEEAAKNFVDNMSKEELNKIKDSFSKAKNNYIKKQQSKLADMLSNKEKLENEVEKLREKEKAEGDYGKSMDLSKQRMKKRRELSNFEKKIRGQENIVHAIQNGGDVMEITDQTGIKYDNIADFRKINTEDIHYDIDTILNSEKPAYIPEIDEDKFKQKGYILDAIRVDKDTYMVAVNEHKEGEFLGVSAKTQKNEYSDFDPESGGYVTMTLDQLVLTNDYYTTKQKAKFKEAAERKNQRNIDYWNSFSDERKEKYYNQPYFYAGLPAKVKKKISKEEWEKLSLKEKEDIHIPVKKNRPEKLKSKLQEGRMWKSFHNMYERFVNINAMPYDKVRGEYVPVKLGSGGGTYGNEEVFKSWNNFSEMLNWKLNDIKIQREVTSEIRKQAIETSFGESNTNNSLVDGLGIKVKRQNGETIKPKEVEQLKNAWESVQNSFGTLKENAKNNNLKLSHSGKRYIFASKAVGMYVPDMKTIAVSEKFGEDQLGFTMGHEVAHWIDHTVGKKDGRRYASDNFESTAGQLAIAFRRNLNQKIDNKYTNSTAECLARSMEQYHAIESYGDDAKLHGNTQYFASRDYVSKDTYYKTIKPLVEQFLQENKDILKAFNNTLFG